MFCVFQAEDGIRDLVRSRGGGDVYKRQRQVNILGFFPPRFAVGPRGFREFALQQKRRGQMAVSYTHLTLPTSDLV